MGTKKTLADLEAPAVHHRKRSHRDLRRALRGETARQAIGQIYPGMEVFGFTKGQFCLVHILELLIDQIADPCDVDISTWSAASGDIQAAYRFVRLGQVRRLRFLVDYSFRSRKPAFCKELIDTFGADSIRVTSIQAKFATIRGGSWHLVVRTSMNLNYNPRFEDFEISDDRGMWRFMADIVDEIWENEKLADVAGIKPADAKKEFSGLFHDGGPGGVEFEVVRPEDLEVVKYGAGA